MEAAYTAGMARLAEFIPARTSGPERWRGSTCGAVISVIASSEPMIAIERNSQSHAAQRNNACKNG
jgi:hypothetical protein